MLRGLAARRPWFAFVVSYYGLIAAIVFVLWIPFFLVYLSQYLYGGPPPWWR